MRIELTSILRGDAVSAYSDNVNYVELLKKVREKDRSVKAGEWRDPALQGYFLGRRQDGYAGIILGIIGLGRIGSRLADLFQPWRIRILAYDPYVDESKFVHHNATPVDMDTLLRESDIVTIHTNLTKETNKLIGATQLAKMKKIGLYTKTVQKRMSKGMKFNMPPVYALMFDGSHSDFAPLGQMIEAQVGANGDAGSGG